MKGRILRMSNTLCSIHKQISTINLKNRDSEKSQ